MSTAIENIDRTIVPRWRDSAITASTGELGTFLAIAPSDVPTSFQDLEERIADWRRNRVFGVAADLMSAAFVLGATDNREVEEAALFVLESKTYAPKPVLELALYIIEGEDEAAGVDSPASSVPSVDDPLREQIRNLKARVRANPRNSVAWVDLARLYVSTGVHSKAERAILNSIALSPSNRFVLRSAARFYVHLGDAEHAYALLRRSPVTNGDPWLKAAEIAVGDIVGKAPRRLRSTIRSMLDNPDFSPWHISELASAIATVEMKTGKESAARRHFRLALQQPTENTVAQATWAKSRINGVVLDDQHFRIPLSYEAKAYDAYERMEGRECVTECEKWLQDEPFSSRPASLGSFMAMVAFEDYERAISFTQRGLLSNPRDFLLRNNLVVATAETGNLDAAAIEFRRIDSRSLEDKEKVTWTATNGLLSFREGEYEKGRECYRNAADLARRQLDRRLEPMVLTHWAREELLANQRKNLTTLLIRPRRSLGAPLKHVSSYRLLGTFRSEGALNDVNIPITRWHLVKMARNWGGPHS